MLNFIAGFFIGGFIGALAISLCMIGKDED